jgi:hypothetical protein
MLIRSLLVWLLLLVAASLNGAVREAVLIPQLGDGGGRAISTVTLCVLILLLTYLTIGWIGPRTGAEAWMVGGTWVMLTLAFEFLAGHYLFGHPWSRLLEDYDVMRGRIWILALMTTFIAPRVCAGLRGLLVATG